jgi:hypothetical protein
MREQTLLLVCVGGPHCGERLDVPARSFRLDLDDGVYWRTPKRSVFRNMERKALPPYASEILLWQDTAPKFK